MIWFFVPASLVICNDVFAYIWGITVGRTPLIKLSPKKTVEGFVGAFFSTVIFGVLWGTYFMRFQYMICPVRDLGVSAFDGAVLCTPNPVFVWRDWMMPGPMSNVLSTLVRKLSHHQYMSLTSGLRLTFLTCSFSLARTEYHEDLIRAVPVPRFRVGMLRVSRRAVWRILRVRVQACL